MKAFATVFPVFLILFLGWLARRRQWITPDQNEGIRKVVFSILFPVMIFDVIFTSDLSFSLLHRILYLEVIWFALYFLAKALLRHRSSSFASEAGITKIQPFLLMTSEGGSVCLPLYTTLVGMASALNIVAFDVAGILMNFVFAPVLIAKETSSGLSGKEILKKVFTSSFVVAVILGIIANLSGLYSLMAGTVFEELYTNITGMFTLPITCMILFTLGYDFRITKSMAGPLAGMVFLRILAGLIIIAGFFVFFPDLMHTADFRTGVFLYFMCPPGFPMALQMKNLCREEKAENFTASFMPVFMIVTMIVYTVLAIGIL